MYAHVRVLKIYILKVPKKSSYLALHYSHPSKSPKNLHSQDYKNVNPKYIWKALGIMYLKV